MSSAKTSSQHPQIVTEALCSQWGYHASIWPSIIERASEAQEEGKFNHEKAAHDWVRQAFPMS